MHTPQFFVHSQDLKTLKCTLKGVLETHFHADFVSGHCELMQRTGATIYFGPGSAGRAKFSHHELKDGEVRPATNRVGRGQWPGKVWQKKLIVWWYESHTYPTRPLTHMLGD